MKGKNFATKLLVTVIMVTMLLGGCGKKEEVKDTGKKPDTVKSDNITAEPTAEAAPELKPVDLTWYFVGNGEVKDSEMVNKAISDYVKDKINANVEIICFDWGTYDSKISNMIATGQSVDIVFTTSWAVNYLTNARRGAFHPIDDLLTQYGQGVVEAVGQEMIDGNKVDGVAYGIPINKEKAHSQGILLNKTYVDKYNFDINTIKTFADFEPMLKTIKENESGNLLTNLNVGVNPGSGPMVLIDYDYISGSDRVPGALYSNNDPSNVVVLNQFDTPEFKEILRLTRQYFLDGYIRPDAATIKNDTSAKDGLAFTYFQLLKPGKALEISNDSVEWVQVEMTEPVMSNSDINNSMVAISSTSKNPERAMMLLNLMYTDKTLMDLVNYGIEDVHYTRIDENTIEPIPDSGYYDAGSIAWQFGNQMIMSLKSNEDPNKMKNFHAFNENATVLRSLGFTFDATEFQTEISAITNVSSEYLPVLLTGSVDPEKYLPEFLDKLKEAGAEKVMAEIQRQYDAFLASK